MVLKFTYLKDLDNVDPFNISRVDEGKKVNREREG